MDHKKAHLSELTYQLRLKEEALGRLTSGGIQTFGSGRNPSGPWRNATPTTQEDLREEIAAIKRQIQDAENAP